MTTDQLIDKKHITAITYFVQIDSTELYVPYTKGISTTEIKKRISNS